MTDIERFDSAEADRVMELLRAQLAAQGMGELAPSEPESRQEIGEPEATSIAPDALADEPEMTPEEPQNVVNEPEMIADEPEISVVPSSVKLPTSLTALKITSAPFLITSV